MTNFDQFDELLINFDQFWKREWNGIFPSLFGGVRMLDFFVVPLWPKRPPVAPAGATGGHFGHDGTTKKSRVRTPPNNDGNIPFHSLFQSWSKLVKSSSTIFHSLGLLWCKSVIFCSFSFVECEKLPFRFFLVRGGVLKKRSYAEGYFERSFWSVKRNIPEKVIRSIQACMAGRAGYVFGYVAKRSAKWAFKIPFRIWAFFLILPL